jgi:molybdopterin-binding protein
VTDEAQRTQSAQGKIVEVRKGATTSHVRIDLGHGVIVTASITNEAVTDLALKTATMRGRRSSRPT